MAALSSFVAVVIEWVWRPLLDDSMKRMDGLHPPPANRACR